MNPLASIESGMTYAALGASIVALCAWMMWNQAKRSNKRAESEGDLDSRVVSMVDMVVKPLNAIIDEERAEKRRAQDERDKIVTKFIEYTTETQKTHALELQKIREDNLTAMKRIHDRMDETDKKHAHCEIRLDEATRRLNNMEKREADRAGAPGAMTLAGPVTIAPAAPAAP